EFRRVLFRSGSLFASHGAFPDEISDRTQTSSTTSPIVWWRSSRNASICARRSHAAVVLIMPCPVGHGHIDPRPPERVPVREARRQETTRTRLQEPLGGPGRGACGWR